MTGTEPAHSFGKDFGGLKGYDQCQGWAHMETHPFTLVDLGEVTWARTEVTRQSEMGWQLEPGRRLEPART